MAGSTFRYVHLHGFASSSQSRKGVWLAQRLARRGIRLELPELNVPSFTELTYRGALRVLDQLAAPAQQGGATAHEPRWRLSGSSMGGYLAARWAELNPDRVDRLLLLCPAFNLAEELAHQFGPEMMGRWEQQGSLSLPGPDGRPVPVSWRFVEDARRHPPWPEVPCPTLILHGTADRTIPIESSRAYAAAHSDRVRLVALPDDHQLLASLERIEAELTAFYALI